MVNNTVHYVSIKNATLYMIDDIKVEICLNIDFKGKYYIVSSEITKEIKHENKNIILKNVSYISFIYFGKIIKIRPCDIIFFRYDNKIQGNFIICFKING